MIQIVEEYDVAGLSHMRVVRALRQKFQTDIVEVHEVTWTSTITV